MTKSPPHNPFASFADAQTAWVISDGTKGMEVQSLGLAERMKLKVKLIRFPVPTLIRNLPKLMRSCHALAWLAVPEPLSESVKKEGYPDLVITCGRRMAGISILMKAHSKGITRTIHIQDPKISSEYFDLLIIPSHDEARGENILVTTGSLNTLTEKTIADAAKALPPLLRKMPKPLIAVMVGGSNKRYSVHWQDYYALGEYMTALATATGASLVFISSRRSLKDAADAIRKALATARTSPAFYIWEGEDKNPYPGILDLASAVVVTSDSVNMTSEACLSGKPVYTYNFKTESGRIALFHQILQKGGYTKPIEEFSPYAFPEKAGAILDETGRVARMLT